MGKLTLTDLRPGDILLYKKTKFINKAISFFDDCKYNHAGVYLGDNKVIESVIKGTLVRSLEESISEAKKVIIMRLQHAPEDMNPVIVKAEEYEGDRYAYEEILMLAVICTARKIPMNPVVMRFVERILEAAGDILLQLTNGDKKAMTCSELVYRSYDEAVSGHHNPYAIHIDRFDKDKSGEVAVGISRESFAAVLSTSDEEMNSHSDVIKPADLLLFNKETLKASFKSIKKKYGEKKALSHEENHTMNLRIRKFLRAFQNAKNKNGEQVLENFLKDNANFVTPGDLYRAKNLTEAGRIK